METPSSARRISGSRTSIASNNKNSSISKVIEDSEKGFSKSRQRSGKPQDRSALVDLTNDSPIIGLAAGNLETPLSEQRSGRAKNTPGSGEAILRGQVKNLLQKVEEEVEFPKISLGNRPFLLQNFVNSPMGLLAPTPANTPQILNTGHPTRIGSKTFTPSPIVEDQLIAQILAEKVGGVNVESDELTRSLLLDFSDKSEVSDSSVCSSALTYQGVMLGSTGCCGNPTSDDDASIWSIQINATTDEEEEEEEEEETDDQKEEEGDDEMDGEDEGSVDELCAGISNMGMNDYGLVQFQGKHTRFVYNSDDELVEEQQVSEQDENEAVDCVSPNVICLKGLPTPQGKHLRFYLEDEDDENSLLNYNI